MTIGGYPDGVPADFRIPPQRSPLTSPSRALPTSPHSGESGRPDLAGGVVIDDFDDDGVLDVMVSSSDPAAPLRYFAGRADGTFVERGTEAGFAGLLGGSNLVQADYDNDGDTDVLVLRGAWFGPAVVTPSRCCATTATVALPT